MVCVQLYFMQDHVTGSLIAYPLPQFQNLQSHPLYSFCMLGLNKNVLCKLHISAGLCLHIV